MNKGANKIVFCVARRGEGAINLYYFAETSFQQIFVVFFLLLINDRVDGGVGIGEGDNLTARSLLGRKRLKSYLTYS